MGVFKDKAFNKSIIRNVIVQDEELCQWKCFLDDTCKSYNLGPPLVGEKGKRVCELSSSHHVSHPGYLVSRPGFIYRSSVVSLFISVRHSYSLIVRNKKKKHCSQNNLNQLHKEIIVSQLFVSVPNSQPPVTIFFSL